MRVTVFGSNGFIGQALTARLTTLGHEVIARNRSTFDDPPPTGGFGTVIWAIGMTAGFRTRPFETVDAHVSALARVLQQEAFSGFVLLSSARVYLGAQGTGEVSALRVAPDQPDDLYNISKLMGESLVLSTVPGARIARLSNVVGPGEIDRDTFLGMILRAGTEGHITLQTTLSSAKDYIWIEDAVDLLIRIASEGQSRIYNVASGRQIRHEAWTRAIAGQTGTTVAVARDASEIIVPPLDVTTIHREFGFTALDPVERIGEMLVTRRA